MSVGIEIAVIDRLEAIAAATAITDRIRSNMLLPDDDYPAVVVRVATETSIDNLVQLTGCVDTEVVVESYAEVYDTCRKLDWAIRYGVITQTGTKAGLADYTGTIGSLTITDATWMGATYGLIEPDDGNASGIHSIVSTYKIRSATPS